MATATLQPQVQARKATQKSIQYVDISADNPSLKTRSENLDKGIVEGYAAIWDSKNSFGEIYKRGAFAKSISDNGPGSASNFKIKFRHEHRETIAQIAEIREDDIGLYFRTMPLDTNDDICEMVLTKLRSGVFNNFSIGFNYVWNAMVWDEEQDAYLMYDVKLWEISVVGIPSDTNTYAIRSAGDISELFDNTEGFIASLPRAKRLEARNMFAEYQTLIESRPLNSIEQRKASTDNEPLNGTKELDLAYIASKI